MSVPRPGLSSERIGFFTDAVFAIAMTLLVVEIPRPEGPEFAVGDDIGKAEAASNLRHYLAEQSASFYAYLLAFVILWVVWRQHHMLLDSVEWLLPVAVRWHLPLLLLVGFLPYTTTVLGHYPSNPMAALLFGVSIGGLLLTRALLLTYGYRKENLRPDVPPGLPRRELAVSWTTTGYWALTLLLVWWTPWIQIAWFLTFAIPFVGPLRHRAPIAEANRNARTNT